MSLSESNPYEGTPGGIGTSDLVELAGVFRAIVVTDDRLTVLADLTDQAAGHFGHRQLRITNVRVAATELGSTILASADFVALGS
jgi:hypothetical protein